MNSHEVNETVNGVLDFAIQMVASQYVTAEQGSTHFYNDTSHSPYCVWDEREVMSFSLSTQSLFSLILKLFGIGLNLGKISLL